MRCCGCILSGSDLGLVLNVELSESIAYIGAFAHIRSMFCVCKTRHSSVIKEAGSSHGLWNGDQFDGAGESTNRSGRSHREELSRGGTSGKFLKVLGNSSLLTIVKHWSFSLFVSSCGCL